MTTRFTYLRSTVAVAIAGVMLAGAAHSTGTRQIERPALPLTAAEEAFPDAPDGVDPVVTGPTSAAFKHERQRNGCDAAVWPQIPVACYPGG